MKRLKNRIIAAATALIISLTSVSATAFASETNVITQTVDAKTAGVSVNSTNVKIYGLDTAYKDVLEIPNNLQQKFQIKVTGANNATYKVIKGESVSVSSKGLITPNYKTYYWNGGIGTSWPTGAEGEVRKDSGIYGESTVRVTANGNNIDIKVNFIDYAEETVDKKMDDFIKKNLPQNATGYDMVEVAAKFAASFEYDAHYSSAKSMVIFGGGDCWASTAAVIKMCEKMGIKAWSRNGNRDPGAGSGHMNAMALADGKYYEIEAGYYEPAPRYYSIKLRTSLFSRLSGTVYQYDGEKVPATLKIPAKIDGVTITAIGENFINWSSTLKKVIIPNGVTTLKKSAFNSCDNLKTLNIPKSVSQIGEFVFTGCTNLTEFTCDEANPNYTISDGVLYNKNKSEIIAVPAASAVTIPSSVKNISDYAFYYNSNITSVTVPGSVKKIGEGVFAKCSSLKTIELKKGVKEIGDYAIAECKDAVIIIPDTVTTISDNAFYSSSNITIYSSPNSAAAEFAKNNNIPWKDVNFTPKAVTGFKVQSKTNNSVTLVWDKSSGASGYCVYQYNTETNTYKKVKVVAGTKAVIKNLQSSSTYKYIVRPYFRAGSKVNYGGKSKTITAYTLPNNPSGVKITAGVKKATISWNKSSDATGYRIYQKVNGKYKLIKTVTSAKYTVTGLKSGGKYDFKITAYKDFGNTIKASTGVIRSVTVQ